MNMNSVIRCGRVCSLGHSRKGLNRKIIKPIRRDITVASSQSDDAVYYQGQFGKWKIEPEDKLEVYSYRAGLTVASVTFSLGTLGVLLQNEVLSTCGTALAVVGSLGLAMSLYQIHIYVTPLKRMLQFFLAAGISGGIYLIVTHNGTPLPSIIASEGWTMWLVGPAFASLSGVCFKEGICYGKAEAFALTLGIPFLCLGHLFGFLPTQIEQLLSAMISIALLMFSFRKFGQDLKDDIGDKSVFSFQNLPEEDQENLLASLNRFQ